MWAIILNVGIQADQRERQPGLDIGHPPDHLTVGTVLDGHVPRPPRVHVGHGQRVSQLALQGWPAKQTGPTHHTLGLLRDSRVPSCMLLGDHSTRAHRQ